MLRHILGLAAVALAVGHADPSSAQRIKAGVLTCDVSPGIGLIIGSQKEVSCMFSPELPGPYEPYIGSITKFGLDIGVSGGAVMVWAVFAGTTGGPGFLAGDYVGASGDVAIAAGLGAMSSLEGPTGQLHCNPFRSRPRPGSISPLGLRTCLLRPGL